MKVEGLLFALLSAFLLSITLVYWLLSRDPTGTTALGLSGGLAFTGIGETIAHAVDRWGTDEEPSLDGILALDAEVRSALTAQLGTGVA